MTGTPDHVLRNREIQPGPGATTRHPLASIEWARQWPCEEVWKARKTPGPPGEPA